MEGIIFSTVATVMSNTVSVLNLEDKVEFKPNPNNLKYLITRLDCSRLNELIIFAKP